MDMWHVEQHNLQYTMMHKNPLLIPSRNVYTGATFPLPKGYKFEK